MAISFSTGAGGSGVLNPAVDQTPQAVDTLFGFAYAHNGNSAATLYQSIDNAFAPNTQYTLSVLVGNAGWWGYPFPTTVRIGFYDSTNALAGLLTSAVATTDITSNSVPPKPANFTAQYYTATFTTGANAPNGPIVIGLSSINATPDGGVFLALFDDVTVTAVPVPEPASVALLGIGAIGLLFVARRRKGVRG